MKFVSIVIPVYNESSNISLLYEHITRAIGSSYAWELIFVNDGSTDSTMGEVRRLQSHDSRVRLLSFTRNFGHQPAMYAGIMHARGEAVITMDGDMQDPPHLLPRFLEQWEKGFPLVCGRRRVRRKDNFRKRLTARLYYWLMAKASRTKVHGQVGDFRLMDQKVVEHLRKMPSEAGYLRGIIAWTGFKHTFVDYERPGRASGKTKYSYSRMLHLALDGLMGFASLPLKLGLVLGMGSIAAGTAFLAYIIYDSMANQVVYPLYKWLIVVILMLIGLLFILLWILSEYICRIYRKQHSRPLYIIDETKSDKDH